MIDADGIERESCLTHIRDDVQWTTMDGVFIKGILLDKQGTIVAQHSHEYAHTSLVVRGAIRVWKDGEMLGDFYSPSPIYIEAKAKHRFQSLEDNTAVYCIHNLSTMGKVAIHEEHHLPEFKHAS